jgi:hypothetical protein
MVQGPQEVRMSDVPPPPPPSPPSGPPPSGAMPPPYGGDAAQSLDVGVALGHGWKKFTENAA